MAEKPELDIRYYQN